MEDMQIDNNTPLTKPGIQVMKAKKLELSSNDKINLYTSTTTT